MALQSCSSSFTYDVFLSFRGSDTRHNFTGNLYKALCNKGIHTFIDDEELQSGEEITPALVKAIQESKIAIVVLSIKYAFSSFCLYELATILDCADSKGLLVLPVFHNVDPSDVRHLKGSYGEALAKHEERLKNNMEKLHKWKKALCQVANLSGYHFNGVGYEYKFIEKIVERVSREINHVFAYLHFVDHMVGLDSRVLQVRKLLDYGSEDGVQMLGIYGMGGVGKSTLAQAVFNSLIAENFDGLCFLENVREESNKQGLKHIQSILLSKILGDKDINLTSWEEGASMIQRRLHRKKVLLIVDDVDNLIQLQAIVGGPHWFGQGSKVIITTRDQQILVFHQIKRTYEVKELNENEARQLLTWKAFKTETVDPRYKEVLSRVVTYASGLPLALEVIGSNLFGKSIQEWESAIKQYKRIPKNKILEILKVSFDALEEEEKSVFLDIACCYKGYALTEVENILRAQYGDCMKYHISVLVKKSLLKLRYGKLITVITLHNLIEGMGKEIVRQESPKEPGKRSRLWLPEDIIEVLEDNKGSSEIEIIHLDLCISDKEETVEWDGNSLKVMRNLKTLIIKNVKFSEGPKCLPNSLRVLEWWGYPSHCFQSDFQPKKLVICKLPFSYIKSFGLDYTSKMFVNLTVLNFDGCMCLSQIPDLSGFPNLEKLSFRSCDNLVRVHESIGFLDKLKELSAFGCRKLTTFPPIGLTSLEQLELSNCFNLENFPEILGKMENIRDLQLEGTSIVELPISFQNLIGLKQLYISGCESVRLPSSIAIMPQLTSFLALRCKGWQWLKQEDEDKVASIVSSNINSLIVSSNNLYDDFFSVGFTRFAHTVYLDLSSNNFTFLPECIKEFRSLQVLDVSDCKYLREIRGLPSNLINFYAKNCNSLTCSSPSMFINQHADQIGRFCFPGAWIPEWFDHQSSGLSNSFWFRNKFPKMLCLLVTPLEFELGSYPNPIVFINGKSHNNPCSKKETMRMEMDHTHFFYQKCWYYVPLENEWNHVEVTYEGVLETSMVKAIGIHVFKQESNNEDIRFDDPYKSDYDISSSLPLRKSSNVWFSSHINLLN